MHHKIIENWLSSILGVFGFGMAYVNIDWKEAVPRLLISMITAGVAGFMGYLGKLVGVWAIRKGRSFIHLLKNKK